VNGYTKDIQDKIEILENTTERVYSYISKIYPHGDEISIKNIIQSELRR
jgi:hypothetical protein